MRPPETPNRSVQQEMVLQQIQNPISRGAIRSAIPANERYQYNLSTSAGYQLGSKFAQLIQHEGGNTYKYILGMATTAQNPNQLSNALGSIYLLRHLAMIRNDLEPLIDQAQDNFLHSARTSPVASDGARALQAEMIDWWDKAEGNANMATSWISQLYGSATNVNRKQAMKHWAEAYILTILDPHAPIGLRKAMLSEPFPFNHGQSVWGEDERFSRDTSFWQHVGGEWVYPDLFGRGTNAGDVKDWEIAGLRAQLSNLQRQVEQGGASGGTAQERAQLRALLEQMQKLVADGNKKIEVYKQIGQHPLDALGIGYAVWKNMPLGEREAFVRSKLRELARKYHTDHNPDLNSPTAKELANKEFSRLKKAQDYLIENKSLDQF
jgi:hypothetical protein